MILSRRRGAHCVLHAKHVEEVEAERRSESRKQGCIQQQAEAVCVVRHLCQK